MGNVGEWIAGEWINTMRKINKPKQDGFGHEKPSEGETNDWITPKWVIDAFDSLCDGEMFFDLDPCVSLTQPWLTARKGYTIEQNGLFRLGLVLFTVTLPMGKRLASGRS